MKWFLEFTFTDFWHFIGIVTLISIPLIFALDLYEIHCKYKNKKSEN